MSLVVLIALRESSNGKKKRSIEIGRRKTMAYKPKMTAELDEDGKLQIQFSFDIIERMQTTFEHNVWRHSALFDKAAEVIEQRWTEMPEEERRQLLKEALVGVLEKFTIRDLDELRKQLGVKKHIRQRWGDEHGSKKESEEEA